VALALLWPHLDEFGADIAGPAYKQVEAMIASPHPHGHRQWRCESEMVGRILRGQAERKRRFQVILPILTQGLIRSKTGKRRAGKNRKAIGEALVDLRTLSEDGGDAVEIQCLVEQACNFYLVHGQFPDTYEQMQPIPALKAAQLPYAGDDGPRLGQAYRMSIDLEAQQVFLSFRFPDDAGEWSRSWRDRTITLPLPDPVAERLRHGEAASPTLREIREPGGSRYAVLDLSVTVPTAPPVAFEEIEYVLGFDWGIRTLVTATAVDLDGHQIGRPFFLDTGPFDGRQARTRRQIDLLKAKEANLETRRNRLPPDDERRIRLNEKLAVVRREIEQCWRKYEARNKDLAHLVANVLLLLATSQGCRLIAGESLKSLKATGRGRDAKGRWRNWRNNSQIRGELWRVLRYKCHLAGIRLEWQQPRKTSHTCPHCGKPADTYRSPEQLSKVEDWGAWLSCAQCGWNGARDYAAALNIARLGVTFVTQYQATGRLYHASITEKAVKPVSYIGAGARLRLPSPVPRDRLLHAGKIYINGWKHAVSLRTSYGTPVLLRLCSMVGFSNGT
jgi:putative transposase